MLIESLISSSFFGQLRSIIQMSTSRDESSPPGGGANLDENDRSTACGDAKSVITKVQRRNTKITRPEIGSLYDIMHDHAGTSLYVVPICWTDRHSELLGAQFQELSAITTPVPDYVPGRWLEPSKMARTITSELHILCRRDTQPARFLCKSKAIKHIMSTFFPGTLSHAKSGSDLSIYFGNMRFKKAVRVACLWKTASHSVDASFDSAPTLPATSFIESPASSDYAPNKPILAYVNRTQLAIIRKNLFRVVIGPNNTVNEPVHRLQRLRSKMLHPANLDNDPYFLGVLIAMAQSHFYQPTAERSSSQSSSDSRSGRKARIVRPTKFHDIKVQLITHDEGNDATPNFVVYTATVSAAFLERFLHPDKSSTLEDAINGDGLKITHTPVPFWPILGLKERLSKALGREIAGDPLFHDPEYIGLWDPLIEQPRITYAPVVSFNKRRRAERAPLSVVHNSSFEEEIPTSEDEDRPVLSPSAKRRRTAR
ncbi:hypothetical protein B0T16DRAFT_348452, partial [Cercophora newfieldiana]